MPFRTVGKAFVERTQHELVRNNRTGKELVMNRFMGSGRLTKNAIVNGGNRKALKFTIAAKFGYDSKEEKERIEFVPCVLFTPPNDKLGIFLVARGKGVFVEFEGRVHTSSFEKDGQKKYSTEVVVENRTLNIITSGEQRKDTNAIGAE